MSFQCGDRIIYGRVKKATGTVRFVNAHSRSVWVQFDGDDQRTQHHLLYAEVEKLPPPFDRTGDDRMDEPFNIFLNR